VGLEAIRFAIEVQGGGAVKFDAGPGNKNVGFAEVVMISGSDRDHLERMQQTPPIFLFLECG